MECIRVGQIINTHGIKGELKLLSLTDFAAKRFKKGNHVYVYFNNEYLEFEVKQFRFQHEFILVQFKDYEDINKVEKFKESFIYVDKNSIEKLDNDEHYFFELKNIDVYSDDKKIGVVSEVMEGYQTVLRIKTDTNEILVPYVKSFIKKVDIDNKRIDIVMIEGM